MQKVLKNLNEDVYTLNSPSLTYKKENNINRIKRFTFKKLFNKCKKLLLKPITKKRLKVFEEFSNEYIKQEKSSNYDEINKEYNTAVGDKILKVLAITMRKVLPPEIVIARIAGDHFGIIMQNTDEKKTTLILDKLITCVKAIPFHYRNTKVDVSISVTGFQITTPMQPTQVISKLEEYVAHTKDSEGKVITRSQLHIIK